MVSRSNCRRSTAIRFGSPRPRNLAPPLKHGKRCYAYVQHASIPNASRRLSLGKYGTAEATQQYEQFLARLRAASELVEVPVLRHGYERVADLRPLWEAYAEKHYTRNGVVMGELRNMREALGQLWAIAGNDFVIAFGPARIIEVRDTMAASGRYSRRSVNAHLGRIKRFWKWACSRQLCDQGLHGQLGSVVGLRNGELGLVDPPAVEAACMASFNAVLPYCPPVVQDMMRVLFLCVMRPEDVCTMHRDGLDRSGDIWFYEPAVH